jgi:hypothetical protein
VDYALEMLGEEEPGQLVGLETRELIYPYLLEVNSIIE